MATVSIDRLTSLCGGSRVLAWLLAVNVGVWAVCFVVWLCGGESYAVAALCLPGNTAELLTRPWVIATYMVTHLSVLHMLFNVLWLYWFGLILLVTMRERDLLTLYIGGGLFGGILYLLYPLLGFAPAGGYLCGASASVLAIMTAAAIRMPDYRINLFIIGAVKLKWLALVSIILAFAGTGGGMSGAQSAHVGGVLFGLAFGLAIRKGISPRRLCRRCGKMRNLTDDTHRKGDKVADFLTSKQKDRARLDELLDKISITGYGGLSRKEKKELEALSRRIGDGHIGK